LIASGGVSGVKDVQELKNNNIPAVVIGKAIYEGLIDLQELRIHNSEFIFAAFFVLSLQGLIKMNQ
jgi:phosphoribosylformimino-5-aminoimidazole carboxamide ribotide isomerase